MDKTKFIGEIRKAKVDIDKDYLKKVINESLVPLPNNNDGDLNLIIVMEELSELQKEISKYIRGYDNKIEMIEELGDVYIGIKYIQELLNISDELLFKAINVKLDRQNDRNYKLSKI